MALTIDIPPSNARVSEEDKFAKYILDGLKENGEKRFLHYGCGWGNGWEEGYNDGAGCSIIPISHDAYLNVIDAFRSKGYSIMKGEQNAAGIYITIKK